MEYKRLTHRNGKIVEEYCAVGHCKYAERSTCNFKVFPHNVDDECVPAMIERLAEIEDKIENGTLIELPCKVGDMFYSYEGFRYTCKAIEITTDGIYLKTIYDMKFLYGKDAFLTREEAEKRLKEFSNDNK